MQVAKFNRSHFGRKAAIDTRAVAPTVTPAAALSIQDNFSGTDPDFDDFGGHGLGKQDTEIAPGIHAEFGCFTASATRYSLVGEE